MSQTHFRKQISKLQYFAVNRSTLVLASNDVPCTIPLDERIEDYITR